MNSQEAAQQLHDKIRDAQLNRLNRQVRSLQRSVAVLGVLIFLTNMLILVNLVLQ